MNSGAVSLPIVVDTVFGKAKMCVRPPTFCLGHTLELPRRLRVLMGFVRPNISAKGEPQ